MVRSIGAVVLGYLVMALVVFAGLSLAYLALGADRAFRPAAYDVSMLWIVVSLLVGFGAALSGGWIARKIARSHGAPRALAVCVVLLGFAIAWPAIFGDPGVVGPRVESLGNFEAMQQARTPLWMMLLNPLVGAVGVLLGGRAIGRRDSSSRHDLAA